MPSVDENALRILSVLIEEGLGEFNRGKLRSRVGLTKEEFDAAHLFLTKAGYIGATMGGDAGSCWVEQKGWVKRNVFARWGSVMGRFCDS